MTKEKYNEYMRGYYAKNKEKLRKYHYQKNKKRRKENREEYNAYMRNYRKSKAVEKILATIN